MKNFIAYDLGTGGIKASLFDGNGDSLSDVFLQYDSFFPAEKFIEQRPMDWWNSVCKATKMLLDRTGAAADSIACVALSGQSLVAVPLDVQGHLLMDQVPIWCDMRAVDQAKRFFETISYESWYETTGNGDPAECYTVMKLLWMKEHQPQIFSKISKILGSKDFVNYKFTGAICTDPSYASGYGVFNLEKWDYEDRFFEAAGIDRGIFPDIKPTDSIIGYVTREASQASGLLEGTPVACGAVDNTCMSLGATGLSQGAIYTSLGSSSWIAVTSQKPIIDVKTRPFIFAHVKKGFYTSAVSIFSTGNSYRWVRDHLCRDLGSDTDAYYLMDQMAESVPIGSNGILFNPSLAGGGSQEPSPYLAGSFAGLTLRNTREDMVRAAMEGVAMALRRTLDILSGNVEVSGNMLICGGGSKSPVWLKIFADIYNLPILKTNIDQNAASLGAAAIAANACGAWQGYDMIPGIHKPQYLIKPDKEANEKYEKLLEIFGAWTDDLAKLGEMMNQIR
jgi:Sugar (pentulose and hexulose) kinases